LKVRVIAIGDNGQEALHTLIDDYKPTRSFKHPTRLGPPFVTTTVKPLHYFPPTFLQEISFIQ
jgi:hypothetical protein